MKPEREPIDHRVFLASVPAQDRAALTARSDAAGLRHLALYLGALGLSTGLILAGLPGWWLVLPVQGVLLAFVFTLQHECTHKTPFASLWINEAVGRACALPLIQPFGWFRYFHLAHHRWTNLPGRDPELDGPQIETRGQWLWHISGLPFWAAGIRQTVALAAGRADAPFMPQSAKPAVIAEARLLLAVYAMMGVSFVWSSAAFCLLILPALIGQPVLRLYLLAEHGDCPRVVNMLANSRTTLTHPAVRFLAWNMPYHAEHHAWPQVPFHALPKVHARVRTHLQTTQAGYAAFTAGYLARRGIIRDPQD